MNKELISKWKPEFDAWLEGKEVYRYYKKSPQHGWCKCGNVYPWDYVDVDSTVFVIADKHFEARKAYALGKDIEYRAWNEDTKSW